MDIGEEPLLHTLLPAVRVVNLHIGHIDVDEEGSGVSEVTESSVIRHHRKNSAVVLVDCGLLELRIRELQMDLLLTVDWSERSSHGLLLVPHQRIGG